MIDKNTDFYKHVDNFAKFSHIGWHHVSGDEELLSKVQVTISIPTYQRVDTLKEAIDSTLNQESFEDYCVLVIDNDPTEGNETERLVLSYNTKKLLYFKNNENIGMFGNQNRCFEIPKSDYVVLLHDDDVLLSDYLSKCDKLIRANSIDYLQPGKLKWHDNGTPINRITVPKCKSPSLKRIYDVDNYLYFLLGTPSSGFFRRDAMIEIGGFNSEYYPTADYCTGVQLCEKFRVYRYSEILAVYRVGKNATMKQETLELFINNDYYLRKQIFGKLKFSKWEEKILLGYIVKSQYAALKSCYNDSFIFDFGRLKLKRYSRAIYLPIRLITAIKVFFYKKSNYKS